jgi:GxxExxY protein
MQGIDSLTEKIIGCAFAVANELGPGFLEKVYENALAHELRKAGLSVVQQQGIEVYYDGILVGEFSADLVVEDMVIVELKACREHSELFTAQCLNYLKATGKAACLLINFGSAKIDIKRFNRPARFESMR